MFAAALGSALERRGLEVVTHALTGPTAPGQLAVPVLRPRGPWWTALGAVRRSAQGADVVVAHGSTTLPACALARPSTTPFVYRSIGDLPQWVGTGLRRRRVAWALGRAAGVSVLWSDLVPYVVSTLGVAPDRVRVLPNAVETGAFPPATAEDRSQARREWGVDDDELVVAHVGALSPEKQVPRLVDAAADRGFTLVLAGSGGERSSLLDRADDRGASVVFLGVQRDLRPVYAGADVVALASRTEGQPAVLIEAALCGRVVVAPRVGGIAELVSDGQTGVLYDPGAGPAGLARALDEARDRARELGRAGPAWARARFDIDEAAAHWQQWLEEIVSR